MIRPSAGTTAAEFTHNTTEKGEDRTLTKWDEQLKTAREEVLYSSLSTTKAVKRVVYRTTTS